MQAVFGRLGACGQVLSCVRPLYAADDTPRARMEIRGLGPIRLRELRSPAVKSGFPDPVSLTFALTCPPSCPHPRRLPALRRSLRRWREPGRSPSSSVAPRRCAPSCWPAPPRRASSACAPASRPARDPSSRRAEPPSGPQSSHRGRRSAQAEGRPARGPLPATPKPVPQAPRPAGRHEPAPAGRRLRRGDQDETRTTIWMRRAAAA